MRSPKHQCLHFSGHPLQTAISACHSLTAFSAGLSRFKEITSDSFLKHLVSEGVVVNAEHSTCRQLQEDHNFKTSFATIESSSKVSLGYLELQVKNGEKENFQYWRHRPTNWNCTLNSKLEGTNQRGEKKCLEGKIKKLNHPEWDDKPTCRASHTESTCMSIFFSVRQHKTGLKILRGGVRSDISGSEVLASKADPQVWPPGTHVMEGRVDSCKLWHIGILPNTQRVKEEGSKGWTQSPKAW